MLCNFARSTDSSVNSFELRTLTLLGRWLQLARCYLPKEMSAKKEPITRLSGGVSQVQSVKNVSFVSFTIRINPKPNADVTKFVSLSRKHSPACALIGCIIFSRREVPEVHASPWWRRRDQGRDFNDGARDKGGRA